MVEYKEVNNGIELHNVSDFDLKDTFECGQCFRFDEQEDGSYIGVASGKKLRIKKQGQKIILDCVWEDVNFWLDFLDLEFDYQDAKEKLSKLHPNLEKAAKHAPGIRILRQEPWEALCSFIISQNNNIPRIKGIVSRLCEYFGEKIDDRYYSFPDAKTISRLSKEDLAPLRCGFRDKYILDAASKVANDEINMETIKSLPIEQARQELMKIKGVGVKVADCALLYGFHRLECFPMDVWMKKAMEELFPGVVGEEFGEHAGIAQQYIYHYMRNLKK